MEAALVASAPRPIELSKRGWRSLVPRGGGVYVIWLKGQEMRPLYVGETAHLHERLGDLARTLNHTFRRQVKKQLERGKRTIGERELSAHIERRFRISYLPVSFGRKELEEYLICRWDTAPGFNQVPARYRRSDICRDLLRMVDGALTEQRTDTRSTAALRSQR